MKLEEIIWHLTRLHGRIYWQHDERDALAQALEILRRVQSETRPESRTIVGPPFPEAFE